MSSNDEKDSTSGTGVDLGEDLLSKPPVEVHQTSSASSDFQIEDQFESARILFGEGLQEDAKKILRKILIRDPSHIGARKKMQEIYDLELKQLFSQSEEKLKKERGLGPIDSDQLMRGLDRDLRLGIFAEDTLRDETEEVHFFNNRKELEEFGDRLDRSLTDLAPCERMDIGIAFYEMELFETAARQFRAAARDPQFSITATQLLSSALLEGGQPFEAALALEPILNDSEIKLEDKIDFFYLMGRAQQGLRQLDKAKQYFGQVYSINPKYRDVFDRLKALVGK